MCDEVRLHFRPVQRFARDPSSHVIVAHSHSRSSRGHRVVPALRAAAQRTAQHVAREKKAAYRDEIYWGRPVPGFGDPRARVLILGLAPAAHGANRTGRVFTGDGIGGSGDFLMAALHRAGFANIAHVAHRRRRAASERRVHRRGRALRAAGQQAAAGGDRRLRRSSRRRSRRAAAPAGRRRARQDRVGRVVPASRAARTRPFARGRHSAHGAVFDSQRAEARHAPSALVIGCYHPSRQNTNTGKVTAAMYDEVFSREGPLRVGPLRCGRDCRSGARALRSARATAYAQPIAEPAARRSRATSGPWRSHERSYEHPPQLRGVEVAAGHHRDDALAVERSRSFTAAASAPHPRLRPGCASRAAPGARLRPAPLR